MDGPDLSHLLDDPNPERPSRELLDVIVRRRRRMQARRARTAATLGLVIALAGAGVGISLSRKGGTTMSASTKGPAQVPTMSNRISATAPSPVSRSPVSSGDAPEGLGWVNAGSTVGYSASASSPSRDHRRWSERRRAACDEHGLGHVVVQCLELFAELALRVDR